MHRNFDKCERCRKIPATIECVECGTAGGQRPMKFCYECDKSYHKMLEKDKHSRGPVKFDTVSVLAPVASYSTLEQTVRSPLRSSVGSPLRRNFNDAHSSLSPLRSTKGQENLHIATINQREAEHKVSFSENQASQYPKSRLQTFNNQANQIGTQSRNGRVQLYQSESQDILSPSTQKYLNEPLKQTLKEDNYQNKTVAYEKLLDQFSPHGGQESAYARGGYQTQSVRHQEANLQRSQLGVSQQIKENHYISIISSPGYATGPGGAVDQSSLQKPVTSDHLGNYYQKMAEEYRAKYLELEKDFSLFKANHDYEIQKTRGLVDDAEKRFNEKLQFEFDQMQRQNRDIIAQKDHQIASQKNQIIELEMQIQREQDQIGSLERLQSNLELDYQQTYKELDKQQNEKDERIERLMKEQEYNLSKQQRQFEGDKESLKKDYEELLTSVKDEYRQASAELKHIIDSKSQEISSLQAELKEALDTHRKERNELEDTLMRDKYSTDLFSMENSKLKQAKGDFDQEREQLIHKISNAEAETARHHLENKELKKKIKKLEKIVYGKK